MGLGLVTNIGSTVRWGYSGTLRPLSEIGPEVEGAQIQFIASFLNLKELNKFNFLK